MRLISIITISILTSISFAGETPKPVRIASGVSGHIHPAACVTNNGTVVVIYCQSDYKDHRVTRSTDGGVTWQAPPLNACLTTFSPSECMLINVSKSTLVPCRLGVCAEAVSPTSIIKAVKVFINVHLGARLEPCPTFGKLRR